MVFVIPALAFEAIQKAFPNHRIKFSVDAVGRQLRDRGALARWGKCRTEVQKRIDGERPWVWVIRKAALGLPEIDADEHAIETRVADLVAAAQNAAPNSPLRRNAPGVEQAFQRLVALVVQARAAYELEEEPYIQGVVEAVLAAAPRSADAVELRAAYEALNDTLEKARTATHEGGQKAAEPTAEDLLS